VNAVIDDAPWRWGLLTAGQAAELSGISVVQIRCALDRGHLAYIRTAQ
jgi:hypothetical protein